MRSVTPFGVLRAPLCRRTLFSAEISRRFHKHPSKTQRSLPQIQHSKSARLSARIEALETSDSGSRGHDANTRLRQDVGKKYNGRHKLFRNIVLSRLEILLDELIETENSLHGMGADELNRQAVLFMNSIDDAFLLAEQNLTKREKNPLFSNLREAFVQRDIKGLSLEIRYSFQSFMIRNQFSSAMEERQQWMLDFRHPYEWYPSTREVQRTVHLHIGPTNSGKTYNALQALRKSKNGVYAGPLRLLAAEVWQRMQSQNIPCALLTGEEIRIPQDTDEYLTSCTVEMLPLNQKFDVVVIDEIQMLGDEDRGGAWSQALMGVQAKELHLCGEERAVSAVQALCASIGDKCVVHRYERLSPLRTQDRALGDQLSRLQKGDAVVAFNRLHLHTLKQRIEQHTGKRCAIVYGSLPPEVRVQQAALFNDPTNDYDYIAASDAIGMGLNLEIRRVVLQSVTKFDGNQSRLLSKPEIKQIGGRAGRYRTATNPNRKEEEDAPNVGYVTTMYHDDLPDVQKAFTEPVKDIEHIYIEIPASIIEKYASYYPPSTPLSFILMRIRAWAMLGNRFKLAMKYSELEVADLIQDLPMAVSDRLLFLKMPISLGRNEGSEVVRALAKIVSENGKGDLLSIKEIPLHVLDIELGGNMQDNGVQVLQKLEGLHVAINAYLWLSYRFNGIFRDQSLAFHVRSLVEERLNDVLDRLDFTGTDLDQIRKKGKRKALARDMHRSVLDNEEQEQPQAEHVPDDTPALGINSETESVEELVQASRKAVLS